MNEKTGRIVGNKEWKEVNIARLCLAATKTSVILPFFLNFLAPKTSFKVVC